ncbi:MAG TPA: hypothetical protein VNV66_18575 [Pilimelia sp.]|nr:hypothetical protein [Pilimelia sp.]
MSRHTRSTATPALRTFTLHLTFLATDIEAARHQAAVYAEALNTLRPEVDSYTARLTAPPLDPASSGVYCSAPGPKVNDMCIDIAGAPRAGPQRPLDRRGSSAAAGSAGEVGRRCGGLRPAQLCRRPR